MIHYADHPRSRGVYCRDAPGAACTRGIIPARAGFTDHHDLVHLLLLDHPRSRGVYTVPVAYGQSMEGSSPLARGLRG